MTMKHDFNPAIRRDDDVDLRSLLSTIRDHRWTLIVFAVAFAVAGVLYAAFASPVYEANAVVEVEQKVPSLPGLDDLTQTLGASTSRAATEVALLTSRSIVGRAVQELRLDIEATPRQWPLVGAFTARRYQPARPGDVAPAWLGMTRYDWGGSKIRIAQLEVPSSLLESPLQLVAGEAGAYTLLDDDGEPLVRGHVGAAASGHGLTIRVDSLQANAGTRFDVTLHARQSVTSVVQAALVATEQGKDSGIILLSYRSVDAARATALLDRIVNLYMQQNVERNAAEAAHSLAFVRQQLPKVKAEFDRASGELNAYQARAGSVDVNLQTKGLFDQLTTLESSMQQVRLQQAEADQRFMPDHPVSHALVTQLGTLAGRKAAIETQIARLPGTQQALLRLTRDAQVSGETYSNLLNQAQQLDIARAGSIGNARVVDPAAVDVSHPVWPKLVFVLPGALVLGLLLGLVVVFVRQLLRRGVEDVADIEGLGLAVYACVPLSRREHLLPAGRARPGMPASARLLAHIAPDDLAIEALRTLRTSLRYGQTDATNNIVMLTSPRPSDGKSFISINLAAVMAQSGQSVVIVDGDMRRGTIHEAVGERLGAGLSDLIEGAVTIDDAIRGVPGVSGLSYISRGSLPANPSELLMHDRFTQLLEALGNRFALVIVNAPPVLAVTDATLIGNRAGTVMLVVRFGVDNTREIAMARQRLEHGNVTLRGVIFNAVERRGGGHFACASYDYAPLRA